MASLEDIQKDFERLSSKQLLNKVFDIREDRIVSKEALSKKIAKKQRATAKLKKKIADMTPEEKVELRKQLLGKGT